MSSPKLLVFTALALLLPGPRSLRADEGMWLFNAPPREELARRYGFEVTDAWLEHLQKASVRISTGGSGSIVSSDGLVLTNHHVGSDILEKLSSADRDLVASGFLARTLAEEIECPEIEIWALWSIEDVTDRVKGAAKAGMSAADANAARRAMRTQIERESEEATGLKSEVVTLYQGGLYYLYRYKRYTDVRLVMAPEKAIAAFGGDTDNFEYPRFCLDMCFFRIYEDGKPLHPEHHLGWSEAGAGAGDLVFVSGHPGRTERMNTVADLEFLRDVRFPGVLQRLWRREVQLTTFSDRSAEQRRIAQGDLLGVQNSRKAYTGLLAGLEDPRILDAKRAAEAELRRTVEGNPEWKAAWGGAWDDVARAQRSYASFYTRYVALGGSRLGLGGDLLGYAVTLVRLADERTKPDGERLREYRESALDVLSRRLESPAPIYPVLEVDRLASGLSLMAELLGGDDPTVVKAFAGKGPRARAEELVRGSRLADVALRKELAEGGKAAVDACDDPLIGLVRALDPEARALRKRYEDEVQSIEEEAYEKIAAARFAIEGENTYPDATFTLRLAFGTVRGYREGGAEVPPFTTFRGLYERHAERAGEAQFELPERWLAAREKLDLDTPFDFVSTPDIIGGNSGSPVVDRAGEVVGLIFDGNLQSLIGDIAYTDEQARAVAVDVRGILEALRVVYRADALVAELLGEGTPAR
jgi:Peptidase S46